MHFRHLAVEEVDSDKHAAKAKKNLPDTSARRTKKIHF